MTDDDARTCPADHRDDRPRRAAEGSALCESHLEALERSLRELSHFPADADESDYDRSVASHPGVPISGTPEQRLLIVEKLAHLRPDVRDTLGGWAKIVVEERRVNYPDSGEAFDTAPFLLRHFDWCVTQPWADSMAGEVISLASRAKPLLLPSGTRTVLCGLCMEVTEGELCGGNIVARLTPNDIGTLTDPSVLRCTICGHIVETRYWLPYLDQMERAGRLRKPDAA